MRSWKIVGTDKGKEKTITVKAERHIDAVGKGSRSPHMLVVKSCVLIEEK